MEQWLCVLITPYPFCYQSVLLLVQTQLLRTVPSLAFASYNKQNQLHIVCLILNVKQRICLSVVVYLQGSFVIPSM